MMLQTVESEIDSCVSINDNVVVDMPAGVKGVNYADCEVTELHYLKPVCLEEKDRFLKKCSNKLCLLDPIPMWLFKDNSTHFIPVLAEIVNVSFATGKFPDPLKETIISPIIKKQTLDPNSLKNFRTSV